MTQSGVKPSATLPVAEKLDHYFRQVERVILSRQHPITGLFPASTAVTHHGDYTDAWVRDNVYTILSAWGLGLAYRRAGCDDGRAYLLEQSVVKTMRGLLLSMMRQSDKVERFKRSRDPFDALHAKYDTATGDTIVADHEWGHLQLDATGLFMLTLAQMTRSGLRIVFTTDEVAFVQNLVYYLGRAYRTPDYGIWERGNKVNDGRVEINASSIGMVKAALEAMRDLNLYGNDYHKEAVVHVVSDEVAQSRITLESLLPRESNSKEVDAALLGIIGFPAFAIEDRELLEKTRDRILEKLEGRHGCKRFLLDGHQTVLEDTSRLHYEAHELKKFEHIESEWPLFFTYLLIDSLFRGDHVDAAYYCKRLQELTVRKNGLSLLPELYYVPEDKVEAEKAVPGSQPRAPNDNAPLVWAQSLFYLGCLIDDGLLRPEAIDPLHRHARIGTRKRIEVQLALLAENKDVQKQLKSLGYPSETPADLKSIEVKEARDLARVYNHIGVNAKLQLTGRPIRRLQTLSTSQVYRIQNRLIVFLPQFQNKSAYYLGLDNHLLVSQLATELHYLIRHWDQPGKPLVTLWVTESMLSAEDSQAFLDCLKQAALGEFDGISTVLGRLGELVHSAGLEVIQELTGFEFLDLAALSKTRGHDWLPFDPAVTRPLNYSAEELLAGYADDTDVLGRRLRTSHNLYEQIDLLKGLYRRYGLEGTLEIEGAKKPVPLKQLVEEVYRKACDRRLWRIIRLSAGLLGKYHDRLDGAVQDIVIRQKQVMVGRSHNASMTVSELLTSREIYSRIQAFCENDDREAQFNQEILSLTGLLIKSKPELFKGMITIRTGHLLALCVSAFADEYQLGEDKAYEVFSELSPFEVQQRLELLLGQYQKNVKKLMQLETLHYVKPDSDLVFVNFGESDDPVKPDEVDNWWEWRKHSGLILSLPKAFYHRLWNLLGSCHGVVIGDRYSMRSRLDTAYIHGAMTEGERSFALVVEGLLNEIFTPEYRYLTVEAIMAVAAFVEVNPELRFDDYLVLDMIIEHALQLDWEQKYPEAERPFEDHTAEAWDAFYRSPPHRIAVAVNRALEHMLTDHGQNRLDHRVEKTAEELGQSLGL